MDRAMTGHSQSPMRSSSRLCNLARTDPGGGLTPAGADPGGGCTPENILQQAKPLGTRLLGLSIGSASQDRFLALLALARETGGVNSRQAIEWWLRCGRSP